MVAPDDLANFVGRCIPSVWALEILFLLRRDAERCWGDGEIVRELRASQAVVTQALGPLSAVGLVVQDDQGCWRYAPASVVMRELTDQLYEAYKARPVAVVNIIARPSAIQSLADAFKFRGGDK